MKHLVSQNVVFTFVDAVLRFRLKIFSELSGKMNWNVNAYF